VAGLDERRKKAKSSGKLFLSGGSRRRRVLSEPKGINFLALEKIFPVGKPLKRVKIRSRQGETLMFFLLFPPVGDDVLTKAKKADAFLSFE
jgi:hypothetical protein